MPNYACPRKHFYIKKGFTILVVLVDRLSCIASACYVVYSTWIFNSKRSSHRNNYRLINLIFQDLTPEIRLWHSLKGSAPCSAAVVYPFNPSRKDGTLNDYGRIVRRDLSTLSIEVSRIRKEMEKDAGLQERMRA